MVAIVATWLLLNDLKEAHYRSVLADYKQSLPKQARRSEVENYLKSRKSQYGVVRTEGSRSSWSYIVRIGTEHNLIPLCGETKVFAAFDFDAVPVEEFVEPPDAPSDVLKNVRLWKRIDCM